MYMSPKRPFWRYSIFQIPAVLLSICLAAVILAFFLSLSCPGFWVYLFLGLAWMSFMWMLVLPIDIFLRSVSKLNMSFAGRAAIFHALFWSGLTAAILVSTLPSLFNQCILAAKLPSPVPPSTPLPANPSPPPPKATPTPKIAPLDCQEEAEKAGSIAEIQNGVIPSTGQEITLSIEIPAQTCTEPVTLSGKIFENQIFIPAEQYNVAFVIDVSSSSRNSFSGQEQVGDLNNDGFPDTILDAEISGFLALTQSIADADADENTTVGVVVFDDSAKISGLFTSPLSISDLENHLKSLQVGKDTNFDIALQKTIEFFEQVNSQGKINLVFFLSDGDWSGTTFATTAELINKNGIGAEIRAIGLGQGSSIVQLDLLDDNQVNNSATQVFSPSALEAGLTGVNKQPVNINYLEVIVNDTVQQKLSRSQLSQQLEFTETLENLSVGEHTVQIRAVFDDPDATNLKITQIVKVIAENQT